MLRKKILHLILLCSFTVSSLLGQTPLLSEGKIPDDFMISSFHKYQEALREIDQSEKRFYRKAHKQFFLESTYTLDRLLQSGRIVFNDPINRYVNQVADILLANHPKLRKEIRFYTSRSPSVNAFSTDKGMIFVNVGLIAQLSTEAELAFVLAHEIVHYVKKHNIELYVKSEKIKVERSTYGVLTESEKYLKTNYWSKEIELETDELALTDYYSGTKYSLTALSGVFDVLQYSYLPLDERAFDKIFLENMYFAIPDKYFPTDKRPIKVGTDYDDSKSTHPSTTARRQLLLRIADNLPNKERHDFILPKQEFFNVRKLARYEVIRQQIIFEDYTEAFYNSYVLLMENHDDAILEKFAAAALYSISKLKSYTSVRSAVPNPDKVEGDIYPLCHFFRNVPDKELCVVALSFVWGIKQKYPDDQYLKRISEDLMNDLIAKHKYSLHDFSQRTIEESKEVFEKEVAEIDSSKLTKYDRIRLGQKKMDFDADGWTRFAFTTYFSDTAFSRLFYHYGRNAKIRSYDFNDKKDDAYDPSLSMNEIKEIKLAEKKAGIIENYYGKALGIDRVIIVDPVYIRLDHRKDKSYKMVESERAQRDFIAKIDRYATMNKLSTVQLNFHNMNNEDIDYFNDLSLCKEWLYEKASNKKMYFEQFETQNLMEVAAKHDARYFMWIQVVSKRLQKDYTQSVFYCIYSIVLPLLFPAAIYKAIEPEYHTEYICLLFDSETSTLKYAFSESFSGKDDNDKINQLIYQTFYQIKNKRN